MAPTPLPSATSPDVSRPVEPRVSNANRVVVGFPFSTIKIEDSADVVAVAELLATLCRLLATSAPADELAELAEEAEELASRLRR